MHKNVMPMSQKKYSSFTPIVCSLAILPIASSLKQRQSRDMEHTDLNSGVNLLMRLGFLTLGFLCLGAIGSLLR